MRALGRLLSSTIYIYIILKIGVLNVTPSSLIRCHKAGVLNKEDDADFTFSICNGVKGLKNILYQYYKNAVNVSETMDR